MALRNRELHARNDDDDYNMNAAYPEYQGYNVSTNIHSNLGVLKL